MRQKDIEKNDAICKLKEFIKPGDTIYTTLKHVSKSGMMRVIDLFIIEDNEPRRITSLACRATENSYNDRHEGMRMDGCGMDMGFAAVYELSQTLFSEGFDCVQKTAKYRDNEGNISVKTIRDCPSNDHNNAYMQIKQGNCPVCGQHSDIGLNEKRGNLPVCSSKCARGKWHHSSGGYALKHRWM